MPDRTLGASTCLWADLPGGAGGAVQARVTDPAGQVRAVLSAAVLNADGRVGVTVSGDDLDAAGLWTVTWEEPGTNRLLHQDTFAVGPERGGLSRWELRLAVAARQGVVVEGTLATAMPGYLTDAELLGGAANYRGRWVMLAPEAGPALAGVVRRVTDFNGSALVLSRPFPEQVPVGTRYALFAIDPRELDRAVTIACRELAGKVRLPLLSPATLAREGDRLVCRVPAGFELLDSVYGPDGVEIPGDAWYPIPGRRLVVDAPERQAGDRLLLAGVRPLSPPVWEDSRVVGDATALIARAALEILATRAGGAGVDVKEHLRRQLVAGQEYEAALKRAVTRLAPGSVPVLD